MNQKLNTNHTIYLKYYRQYKNKIYNYFYYRVNFNCALAEDLTSEVFTKALIKFDYFDEARSFQAWIYKIAQNHLFNHYRDSKKEVNLEESFSVPHYSHKKIEASVELEKVLEQIKCLDPYYREVLLLRFVDELNNQEIANLLEKEEGAIRTQISRALKHLREELNKYG